MTKVELLASFRAAVLNARTHVARALSPVFVAMLEGLGYRVVPAWVVDQFEKVIERAPESST